VRSRGRNFGLATDSHAEPVIASREPSPPPLFSPRGARTRDGVQYVIRAIRSSDDDLELRFIESLSETSRYNRMMYALSEATPAFIRSLVDVDYRNTMAVIAVLPADVETMLGVARYATESPGATQAEFAVTVADAWQRRGIGQQLLRELTTHARDCGITTLRGTLLATNEAMIGLARALGVPTRRVDGDAHVVEAILTVSPQRPGQ
jgi:acetyltransferase